MTTTIKDFLKITEASQKYKIAISDILFAALEGKVSLYVIADKDIREALVPCKEGELHHASPGEFMHQYQPLLDHLQYVDVQLGQPLRLNEKALKDLIVNNQFSEAELYRELGGSCGIDIDFDFLKTEREVYDWKDLPPYALIAVEQVQLVKQELREATPTKDAVHGNAASSPSNASLKVIGLLMYHLAKSPKYASGTSPNKSQIKELLLDLALELEVDPYGLNKADERVLSEAMRYLGNQKL